MEQSRSPSSHLEAPPSATMETNGCLGCVHRCLKYLCRSDCCGNSTLAFAAPPSPVAFAAPPSPVAFAAPPSPVACSASAPPPLREQNIAHSAPPPLREQNIAHSASSTLAFDAPPSRDACSTSAPPPPPLREQNIAHSAPPPPIAHSAPPPLRDSAPPPPIAHSAPPPLREQNIPHSAPPPPIAHSAPPPLREQNIAPATTAPGSGDITPAPVIGQNSAPPPSREQNIAPATTAPGSGDITPAPVIGENANLDELIKYIKNLLQLITAGKGSSRQKAGWPTSSSFCKLKKFLSEGITDIRDTNPDQRSSFAKTIVQTILKEIGHAQWITAGLLVVADILERFENVSSNRSECLTLLDEMTTLAEYLMVLQERPGLREGMENTIKEAIELIVEASLMCSTQIDPSKFSRFFLTPINKEELGKFGQQLHAKYKQINVDLDISVTANKRNRWREYPDHAVGIEESVGEVIDLLECESENNAVAVILHGPGGIGKTTLADAVFSRIHIENCKYSMVEILEKIDSTSKIINLQKMILRDLIDSEEPIPDIRKYEDGQRELSLALEKVPAFICIDNVLCHEELQNILPKDMKNARKIRLLLTTRDINVRRACRMKTRMYSLKGLPDTEAMCLLKKEMYDGIHPAEDQINPSQLQQLIEICKGVPQHLSLIAGIIRCEGEKQSAYSNAMELWKRNKT